MIEAVTMFVATCDRCGEQYSVDGDSVTVFHEEDGLRECINQEDEPWYFPVPLSSGTFDQTTQKCYCPECFTQDENGIKTVKTPRRCRVCGCTDLNCSQCIEKTGEPCSWVEDDLCSACQ